MGTGPIEQSQAAPDETSRRRHRIGYPRSTVIRTRTRGLARAAGACGKGLELNEFAFHGVVAVIDG